MDNPDSYNFRPKEMLREICTTISQFSTQPGFHKVRWMGGPSQACLFFLWFFAAPHRVRCLENSMRFFSFLDCFVSLGCESYFF